jgi:CxxC motif-containing protein (DUF1111 family)
MLGHCADVRRWVARLCVSGRRAASCLFGAGLFATVAHSTTAADPLPAGADHRAAQLDRGRELFTHAWRPGDPQSAGGDGLGPVFNAQSCVDCHDQGGIGGAGGRHRNIEIASLSSALGDDAGYFYAFSMNFGGNGFEYRIGTPPASRPRDAGESPLADPAVLETIHPGFRQSTSVVLHRYGVDPGYPQWRAGVVGSHGPVTVRLSERNPTPLFGVGLIDAISDDAIEQAAAQSRKSKSTRGRVARTVDGRVGRFGWKGQTARLEDFVRSAAAGELGLEVPGQHQSVDPRRPGLGAVGLDLDAADLEALTTFVRSLPQPQRHLAADRLDAISAGESLFRSIGCAACHTPDLGDVKGIYSDLLLHSLGDQLEDTGSYIAFGSEPVRAPAVGEEANRPADELEWQTPPLWGLRHSAPYLHDGRAPTVAAAIELHGGQAAAAAKKFGQLSPKRRQQLLFFLDSL